MTATWCVVKLWYRSYDGLLVDSGWDSIRPAESRQTAEQRIRRSVGLDVRTSLTQHTWLEEAYGIADVQLVFHT